MQIQLTRRTALKTVAAAGAAILIQPVGGRLANAAAALEWRYFQADDAGLTVHRCC